MLYYKNGRFRMDSVSYELPEGVYIDTEFQSVIVNFGPRATLARSFSHALSG